jgi:endonuclease YncB( thermonuclease family)
MVTGKTKSMPDLNYIRILCLAAFFISTTDCSENQPLKKGLEKKIICKCIGISDGDTITVLTKNKKQYKVRLAHIDCPEKGQPFGKNARQFTADFCFNKLITVIYSGEKDRNGRVIGVVMNDAGENLNESLVKAGLAWHFKKYSDEPHYTGLENAARNARTGLWQDANPVAPWEWRRSK